MLAAAPEGWGRGSPCGESIARLATYLRYVHATSYQRLRALLLDVFVTDREVPFAKHVLKHMFRVMCRSAICALGGPSD